MARRGVEEAVDLGCSPCLGLLDPLGLGDRAGETDTGGRAAWDQSFVDGLAERRPQHVAADLHAAPRELAALGEVADPGGDVVAVEQRELDRAEPVLDVRDRPLVLLTRT